MFEKDIILTEEQQTAVDACVDFIKNGNSSEFFTLIGKAGTGKTTIIRKVLKQFRGKSIIVGALSHKAKKVIAESVKRENIDCKVLTVAAMLGMKLEEESGKFIRNIYDKKLPPISNASLIIIDEASMISEEALRLLFLYKGQHSKIIFLSDQGQLEPIREEASDLPSPVFNTVNKALLTTRIRQSETHPVLNYADFYWENSQMESPLNDPVPEGMRVNKEQDDKKLKFVDQLAYIFPILEEKFREAIKVFNPNKLKIVTYRNNTRREINKYFHEILFTNKETGEIKEYNVGELIIFNDSYEQGFILIDNASEFQVKRVLSTTMKIDNVDIKVYSLDIDVYDDDDQYITLPIKVLAEQSTNDYKNYVSKLFAKAKLLPEKSKERSAAMAYAWGAKNKYANVDYAYSITSHKAQGSTYETVVVHESDILSTPISIKTKSRSIYTALTRAKYEVYVV